MRCFFVIFIISIGNLFSLSTDINVVNFGVINNVDRKNIDLLLYNKFNEQEIINLIKPSCGCTSCDLEGSKILNPGEKRILHLTINNNGVLGYRKIDILIFTKGKNEPLEISLVGYAIGPDGINISKSILDYGEFTDCEKKTKMLAVYGTKDALSKLIITSDFPECVHYEIDNKVSCTEYPDIYKRDVLISLVNISKRTPPKISISALVNLHLVGKVDLLWTPAILTRIRTRSLALGKIQVSSKLEREIDLPIENQKTNILIESIGPISASLLRNDYVDSSKITILMVPDRSSHGIQAGKIVVTNKSTMEKILMLDWTAYFD